MKNNSLGIHARYFIFCKLGPAIGGALWLVACQPITAPLNSPAIPSISHTKAVHTKIEQHNKDALQNEMLETKSGSVSLVPPRSILVIEELDQKRAIGQKKPIDDVAVEQPSDQTVVEEKTLAKILAAKAVMNSLTWQFQAGAEETETLETNTSVGQDLSSTKEAFKDTLIELSNRENPSNDDPVFELPPKLEGVVRVGLLVPLSGKYAALGTEIRRSIEMALFTFNNPKIEVLFLDTKAGENARNAAMIGIKSDVDIFIGPLFTEAVIQARAVMDGIANVQKKLPMLLLSNNVDVATTNGWLMGYLPEQQLDGLLGHAISEGKRKFALIGQNTTFGQRLLVHANRRLVDFGLRPEASLILSDEDLTNENNLKSAIREFARYEPPLEGEIVGESPFDVVVFAGDPAFALRTAPVLAYYDVGPDRALYLGNALWNQSQLLGEPSLQGGLFSIRPSDLDLRFESYWDDVWPDPAGQLARVGFDAMALVAALVKSGDKDWTKQLVSNKGFQGFSGAFRLLPDGRNIRSFELRQIQNGNSKIIKSASNKI